MEDATPVRIRGKKRNRDLVQAHQANITDASAKRARVLATSLSSRQMQYQAATPTLQGMPTEILEMIFLHSMNIALPRASPDLGQKLSSRYVTMEYTMRTFYYSGTGHITERSLDKVLQSDVLACRFFTYDFFWDYANRAYQALKGDDNCPTHPTEYGPTEVSMAAHKIMGAHYLCFAPGFLIPEKLLHGPWTEDKMKLLYTLTCLYGRVDFVHTMAGEIMREGLTEAMGEGNEHVVAALAAILGVNRRLTTDMLRHAVLDCGCQFNIVKHLLNNAQMLYSDTPRDQLNLHDPVLWQWADDEGGEKGHLLKELLREAETCEFIFKPEKVDFPFRQLEPVDDPIQLMEQMQIMYTAYCRYYLEDD